MSRNLRWVLILVLALLGQSVMLPAAGAGSAGEVSVLSQSAAGVTFAVAVPWEELRLEPVTADGVEYVRVSLPGWAATSQAGAPALPLLTRTLGVPFGVQVSIRVVAGAAHTVALPAPALPVKTQQVEWVLPGDGGAGMDLPLPHYVVLEDPAVYGGTSPYPAALARVASDGVVRQQRVVGIVVCPVQYHAATRELTVYESLRVDLAFEGTQASGLQAAVAESEAYESLLRDTLLNYEGAKEWRRHLTPDLTSPIARGAVATPNPSPSTGEGSSVWAPPVPGWRVKVRGEGFYKLTYSELQNAGLAVGSLDPRTFRLYNLGSEVAIDVAGQADGRFDAADYLLFYGQSVSSKYTADNVYWLTYGQGTGLRMGSRSGTPGAGQTPASYPAFQHVEQNAWYISTTPGSDDLERWMWYRVVPPSSPSWSYTLTLAAPYAAPATLRVAMLGYLESATINPDHHATIHLNGTQVGNVWWDGRNWQVSDLAVPAGLLVAGNNTISILAPNDTGVDIPNVGAMDNFYIDWVELEFANTFRAVGDVLGFGYSTAGTWKYVLDGFSNNQVAVYDITNPAVLVRIEGVALASSALGYKATFQDSIAATTRYWAMATSAYRTVQGIEADTSSNLQSTGNGADHIIITPQAFAAQVSPLRDLRAAQSKRAMLVDLQDVYDEFGYGIVGARPIRDFLAYAYAHWQAPAPSIVVLVGDGHSDPKNYLGYGRVSYLPPYLAAVDPWIGETAGDNRYVTLVGSDTLPDMMLGRLAVNSSAEASAFVNKILAYEQTPVSGDWQKKVLAVADDADSAGDFAAASDGVLNDYLPDTYQATKVYYGVTHTNVADARAAIVNGINSGTLIVNYVGHGGERIWAGPPPLLEATDVATLTNGDKTPVILAMTCYEGAFHYPQAAADGRGCMAEMMTRADGKGAVASWSPTGLGLTTGHDYLDRGFFEARFQAGKRTLGEATAAGKLKVAATGSNLDLLDTYLLFGDPAMRLLPDEGLRGDVNGDCVVDIVDIMLVASRWNTSAGQAGYDAQYDLDGNGQIDIVDIMIVAARWNTHC